MMHIRYHKITDPLHALNPLVPIHNEPVTTTVDVVDADFLSCFSSILHFSL